MFLFFDLPVENAENFSTNEILDVIQELPKDVWIIMTTEVNEERFASTVSSSMYTQLVETADQMNF